MSGPPWVLFAIGSLVLAAVFGAGAGVPSRLPSGPAGTVIRWAHMVVWILMAAMFAALAVGPPGEPVYPVLGLLALALYVTYLTTLLRTARR